VVELETQYELIERQGNGLGLAFAVGYGWATQAETPDEVEFGPIIELGLGTPEPAGMELSMNVGVQFGLTDVTSDTALKFQGSIAF
jgi:hypothetical protein